MTSRYINAWVAAGVGTATVVGAVAYVQLRRKLQRRYVKVGKVSKLLFYPMKAFAAHEVQTAHCTKSGIKVGKIQDRMWTVVNENGHVDQKEVPRFALLRSQLVGDEMCVEGPGMDTLKLKVLDKVEDGAEVVKCKVFNTFIDVVDCGEEAAKWIQQFSGKPALRIVQYVPGFEPRPAEMRGLCNLKAEEYPVIFQAEQPFLVLSEASIKELNSRVQDKVTCLNFRPNFVIDGCKAFDEDKWKYIKIGEKATLVKTLASSKCVRVTVNTKTGDKKSLEPLATLRKFRTAAKPNEKSVFKHSPLFGMYYGLVTEGEVSVGDDVFAVYD